jgi:ubiquinone/menaquinone biosynthesis C-methylase UbiE
MASAKRREEGLICDRQRRPLGIGSRAFMATGAFDSEQFKVRDASSYDPVTAAYDRFTERFTRPLSRRMVELAVLRNSDHVLDIGSGTGIVTCEAAKSLGKEGRVTGVDLSSGMIRAASEKAAAAGLAERVTFLKGDGEALDLRSESFDAVLSLFVMMHFPHPEVALGEMYRVLRPGGRLVIAFGSGPPLWSLVSLIHYLGRVPEAFHRLQERWLSAPAFLNALVCKYLPESEQPEESPLARANHKRASMVERMVRKAGFERMRRTWQGHVGSLETPQDFWELQAIYSSLARKRLESAPVDRLALLKDEFFTKCRHVQERNGWLVYPYAVRIIIARRPLSRCLGAPAKNR